VNPHLIGSAAVATISFPTDFEATYRDHWFSYMREPKERDLVGVLLASSEAARLAGYREMVS